MDEKIPPIQWVHAVGQVSPASYEASSRMTAGEIEALAERVRAECPDRWVLAQTWFEYWRRRKK